jgi:hypothetical protein
VRSSALLWLAFEVTGIAFERSSGHYLDNLVVTATPTG